MAVTGPLLGRQSVLGILEPTDESLQTIGMDKNAHRAVVSKDHHVAILDIVKEFAEPLPRLGHSHKCFASSHLAGPPPRRAGASLPPAGNSSP